MTSYFAYKGYRTDNRAYDPQAYPHSGYGSRDGGMELFFTHSIYIDHDRQFQYVPGDPSSAIYKGRSTYYGNTPASNNTWKILDIPVKTLVLGVELTAVDFTSSLHINIGDTDSATYWVNNQTIHVTKAYISASSPKWYSSGDNIYITWPTEMDASNKYLVTVMMLTLPTSLEVNKSITTLRDYQ